MQKLLAYCISLSASLINNLSCQRGRRIRHQLDEQALYYGVSNDLRRSLENAAAFLHQKNNRICLSENVCWLRGLHQSRKDVLVADSAHKTQFWQRNASKYISAFPSCSMLPKFTTLVMPALQCYMSALFNSCIITLWWTIATTRRQHQRGRVQSRSRTSHG